MDHKFIRAFFCIAIFGSAGLAMLYGVFRSIKSGRVILFNKVTGASGYLYRKDAPKGFWFPLLIYASLGIFLICVAIFGTYHDLSAK